jgi:hypothetical protein
MAHAGTMARAPRAQHRRAPPTRPVTRVVFLRAFSVAITPTSPAAAEKIHEAAERSGIRAPGERHKRDEPSGHQSDESEDPIRVRVALGSRRGQTRRCRMRDEPAERPSDDGGKGHHGSQCRPVRRRRCRGQRHRARESTTP